MQPQTNSKTIAKNTMFLYFRMMVTMIISLYTSRVVLQVLGVDDYGIYQAVGGIVGLLSFINGALGAGSSRFITFGLGEGNIEKLKNIFTTTLTGHIILALIIVLIAETAGLWFLHHKMVIPPERMDAALWVFHLSLITAFFTLTQVPYNACIIAHERMTVYAYVSIVDAVCKLLIVYMLMIGQMDKLILYAILHVVLQVTILLFYRLYGSHHFEEAIFRIHIDNSVLREILGFSGWSMLASSAIALNSQGILVLLNMFFLPGVVAARSISIQVNMAANQFVTNFQTAAIPQIVKRYAAKDYDGSKQLLLETAKYSFYLMLLLSIPICFTADQLLALWLGVVPPYTVIFLQLIIVQSLFQVFDTTFYYALYAKGQLRENALISPTLGFLCFPIVYVLFRLGYSPIALSWVFLILYAIIGLIVKPILVIRIVNYTWCDVLLVFIPCLKVTLASLPLPLLVDYYMDGLQLPVRLEFLSIVTICVISVGASSWFLGLTPEMRAKLLDMIKSKLKKK